MTKAKMSFAKPTAEEKPQTDRFEAAAGFAKASKEVIEGSKDESRVNWDCPNYLHKELKQFVAGSSRFATKKEFLTQCLIDGLKNYKGQ
ncbi:TPA: hypothetical protein LUJ82_000841 [Acinetobacter baumannii]|jgi:hypothetical protein|uniref:hypothetical protein n=1 Tax=Acinetobacter TaxID=469 RepID=UPI0002CE5889|nr:hypothetical protein [Acinetobacter baumannii]EKT7934350.1 hypothetical protein [Acinetobacter baumannii]EKT8682753.1 hypothetical protein [Acinetobacter baumannii]EKT9126094.1 hypothetical protein [Acinetobacter baumannii]EKT9294275.1 hypothetical protein [Acinetobacter baumannii]EKU3010462.1 hypothetical protein [Acinetobacter baumannii]